MSMQEVTEQPHFESTSFRVRGKIFATVPPDGMHMHVFVSATVRTDAMASHPEAVSELAWGRRIVGLRIDLGRATPTLVKRLVRRAWLAKAPASLIASDSA